MWIFYIVQTKESLYNTAIVLHKLKALKEKIVSVVCICVYQNVFHFILLMCNNLVELNSWLALLTHTLKKYCTSHLGLIVQL